MGGKDHPKALFRFILVTKPQWSMAWMGREYGRCTNSSQRRATFLSQRFTEDEAGE